MAEIFSLVSAGVGIVAFIGQVSATLEKLRFLKEILQTLQQKTTILWTSF
ncbi:hypothetical protein VDGD_21039 [Verticillium dahliae]|nr:hypothetical protein VDGD_21039 [Verticillium dahliae]